MKRKLIFVLLAALLLTPWPVAYAYDDGMVGQPQVQIEAAAPATVPELNAFGKAVGGITPGDLFYINILRHGYLLKALSAHRADL